MSRRFVQAPFTPAQVNSINGYQQAGALHPFTCPCDDHDDFEDEHVLRATTEGLHCTSKGCAYRQNWCHGFMADGSWESVAEWREAHLPQVVNVIASL